MTSAMRISANTMASHVVARNTIRLSSRHVSTTTASSRSRMVGAVSSYGKVVVKPTRNQLQQQNNNNNKEDFYHQDHLHRRPNRKVRRNHRHYPTLH